MQGLRHRCWKGHSEWLEETFGYQSPEHLQTYRDDYVSSTCFLQHAHEGEHHWTPDSEVSIKFAPASEDGGNTKDPNDGRS